MYRIVAVVVTYFPDYNAVCNIFSLLDKVGYVVVVDNTPGIKSHDLFLKLFDRDKVEVIFHGYNYGVGFALNVGVEVAIKRGAEWVLTLDQDSSVPPGMIDAMFACHDRHPEKTKIASLAPRYCDSRTGIVWGNSFCSGGDYVYGCTDILYALTSGNLVKIDVFNKVGPYNESYIVDYVDVEFGLRISLSGMYTVQVNDALLHHSIGEFVETKFLYKYFILTLHAPLRRYYMYRNATVTYKKYFPTHRKWVFQNSFILLKTFFIILLFEPVKYKKFKAIFYGIIDGIRGASGECKRSF